MENNAKTTNLVHVPRKITNFHIIKSSLNMCKCERCVTQKVCTSTQCDLKIYSKPRFSYILFGRHRRFEMVWNLEKTFAWELDKNKKRASKRRRKNTEWKMLALDVNVDKWIEHAKLLKFTHIWTDTESERERCWRVWVCLCFVCEV